MDIPQEVQKCVAFVGYRLASGEEKVGGSAFFVFKLSEDQTQIPLGFRYVVTAAHCIERIRDKLALDTVLLRVNRKSGNAAWLNTALKDWHFHPDKSVDVAVLPLAEPLEGFDVNLFPLSLFIDDESVEMASIGVGNDVFVVGLFHRHYGEKNNIPIVRVGNIAAMPVEKVNSRRGPIDAYLVEARSIGGLSGSPVFLPLGFTRTISGLPMGQLRYYLLGLMHGHFDVHEDELTDFDIVQDASSEKNVNMGIAIVVPINKVLETIQQPKLIEWEKSVTDKARENIHR